MEYSGGVEEEKSMIRIYLMKKRFISIKKILLFILKEQEAVNSF